MSTSKVTPAPLQRSLSEIAREIRADWPSARIYFGAEPYLGAMAYLSDMSSSFGDDDADEVVLRFLSNASTWRGTVAQRVKAELRAALAHHAVARHLPTDITCTQCERSDDCECDAGINPRVLPAGPARLGARRAARKARTRQAAGYDPLANPRGARY